MAGWKTARGGRWIDWVAAFCALGGLLFALCAGMDVRSSRFAVSDYKTLYASGWCLAHGLDAYSIQNIEGVFAANHVVAPETWYGHMPVYPPFTLAVLMPLTVFPMVQSAFVWIGLSGLLMAFAVVALCRASSRFFGLPVLGRLGIIVLCAAGPLLGFGVDMGNVSVAVSALCILAVLLPEYLSSWIPAIALSAGILLKPHIAVWVCLAMLIGDARVRKGGRRIARRSVALCGLAGVAVALWLGTQGMLGTQLRSYKAVVWSETHSGSMSPTMREPLPVVAQITSLQSTVGYWGTNHHHLFLLNLVICGGIIVFLLWTANRMRHNGAPPERRLLYATCWCVLGLTATYHRAHDGIVLLMLVPWVVGTLWRSWKNVGAWLVIFLYAAVSCDFRLAYPGGNTAVTSLDSIYSLFFYRQAGIAMLLLEFTLLVLLHRSLRMTKRKPIAMATSSMTDLRSSDWQMTG